MLRRRDLLVAAVWTVGAVAAMGLCVSALHRPDPTDASGSLAALDVVGAAWPLAVPVSAYVASAPPFVPRRLFLVLGYIWALVLATGVVAMLISAPAGSTGTAGAAGLDALVLAIPTALLVAALGAVGAGVRWYAARRGALGVLGVVSVLSVLSASAAPAPRSRRRPSARRRAAR